MKKYKFVVFELTNRSEDVEASLNYWGNKGYTLKNFYVDDPHVQIIMEKEVCDWGGDARTPQH